MDIILSDYNMPYFSTIEALEIIKESCIDVPFLIVSGAIGEENAVQLMREGAHDYIMKDNIHRLTPAVMRELQEAEHRKSRKIAESLYRKSDFILNLSKDMMALINREYIYESVNKSFCNVLKKAGREEIIGNSVSEIWGEEIFQNIFKVGITECLNGEEKYTEGWIDIPDNGKQCFEIVFSPYMDSGNTITHVTIVMRNITVRKMMDQKLKESYQKLQRTLDEIVSSFSTLVEMRDPYTAGHQNRVASIAQAIAREMKIKEDSVKGIWVASMIHDIGKNSIPSDILSKPGRITEMEFELIKEHSRIGYEILKNIEFFWPVANIVLQHHERINGSGYPQGLKGDDILLESKIIGVADVVEAMTFRRPYREALGLEAALHEIEKNKNILYDPEVVDACIRIFTEKDFKIK